MTRRLCTSVLRFARLTTPLLTVVLVACGVPRDSTARLVPNGAVPEALDPSASVPPTSVERQRTINVWFLRDSQLVRVRHTVPASTTQQMVIDTLLAGPTDVERRDSLRSAIPDSAAVGPVVFSRGDANVRLSPAFAAIPTGDQLLAVSQLVLTLTDMRGVGRVTFTVDGQPVSVPLPGGGSSSEPVTRDDYIDQSVAGP
jgi:spore germination protein GerM